MSTTNPERTLYRCFTLRIRKIQRDNRRRERDIERDNRRRESEIERDDRRSYLASQNPQLLYWHLHGSGAMAYRRGKTQKYNEWIRRDEPWYWEELQEEKWRREHPAYNDKRWSEGNALNKWISKHRPRETSLADLDGLDEEEEETLRRERGQSGRSRQRGQAERSDCGWRLVASCVVDILRLRVNECVVTTHTHF
jgi:hypothetical protein